MPESPIDTHASQTVSDAISSRRSVRAFTSQTVPEETVREILTLAARAPSGTNIQPWHTHLLMGDSLKAVIDEVHADFDADVPQSREVKYYPDKFTEPYLSRRRTVGWGLYNLLGIGKRDLEKMKAQHRRNYQFFDAPVGLLFTIDRNLNTGSWLDYGMFIQNITLLARERGLHTCIQAAWSNYHSAVRRAIPLEDSDIIVCGIALGYADEEAVENTLETERASLEESMTVHS